MTDINKIKQLREETNVSYLLCRTALDEANGNLEKAREILRQKGAEVAAKKSDRETSQGAVFSYIHHNKKIGSLVVLNCETDFVAINDEFQALGNNLAMHVASTNPTSKDELLKSAYIKDSSVTVDQLVKEIILKLGENIHIGEFIRYEI